MAAAFDTAGTPASGTSTITPALPAGWVAGDLLILFVESANQNIATPSGWTQIAVQAGTGVAAAVGSVRLAVFYKIAGAGETAPTLADSGNHTYAQILSFNGHDPTTPIDSGNATVSAATGGNTATPFIPRCAATTNNDTLVVSAIARGSDVAGARFSSWANSDLVSISEVADDGTIAGTGGGVGVATGVKTTAGSMTQDTTVTDVTAGAHVGAMFGINPSASGSAVAIAATVAGIATLSAALSASRRLAAAPSGAGQVAAQLAGARRLAATSAGVSQVSSSLRASRPLQAITSGVGTVTATLSTSALKALAATVAGVATVAVQLRAQRPLQATATGTATVAATALRVSRNLAAQTVGTAAVAAAALSISRKLTTSVAGVGTVTATDRRSVPVQTIVAGQATVTPSLLVTGSGGPTVIVDARDRLLRLIHPIR